MLRRTKFPTTDPARSLVLIGLLVLLVTVAYLPVFRADFTNYDDPYYVTNNPAVLAGVTWQGVQYAFSDLHTGNWHPVTWLSHMLDCQVFGTNPTGHHAVNLLFHL